MENILYKNFKVIKNGKIFENLDIYTENGIIKPIPGSLSISPNKTMTNFPNETNINFPSYTKIIDGRGLYLSAGFIDIHTHGGAGFDFMDADPCEYIKIANHAAKHGCTAIYPTTISASREELEAVVCAFESSSAENSSADNSSAEFGSDGAVLLGIHMEGPYLALSQKGAMDALYIRNPIKEEYENLCGTSQYIKRITFAPELDGSAELCSYLNEKNIIPSIGHTDCICSDVVNIHENCGCNLMTHLYSAMSMTRRIGINRFAGAVEAAYLLNDMYTEVIADGIHLPADLLKLIYKIKGCEKIVLITDSMRGAGLPDGGSAILGSRKNGMTVLIEDGVAKLPDKTAFAGSIATAHQLIKTMTFKANVPLAEAVLMLTENPARVMKIFDKRGSIDFGKRADFTIFDDDINIKSTVIGGKAIF